MSIKTFDSVYEFGRAISESSRHELRFRGKSDDEVFEFDTDTDTRMVRFKLPVGDAFHKTYLNGILDEDGISVFRGKRIWIDGEVWTGFTNCKGMFAQMEVETMGYGFTFDDVDVNAEFMFNESDIKNDYIMKVIGGRLYAKGMFRGCKTLNELRFVSVQFHDITRLVADSSIRELTFYNCDLACDKTEFEANIKSCMYKNSRLETIRFESCSDAFVESMIEHINRFGEDDDNIVIHIRD